MTWGVLAAIAVGIGSQYLPRRLPLRIMARFSRLPIPAQAGVLALGAPGHPRDGARRAWHRSSTSSSDGDPRQTPDDVLAGAPPREAGACTRPGRRSSSRSLGAPRRAAPERSGPAQVGDDPAGGLEARRRARRHRTARERERTRFFLDRPRAALKAALGRSGRRRDRHGRRGAAAEADDARRRRPRLLPKRVKFTPNEEAPPLDRRRLARRRSRRVGAPRDRRQPRVRRRRRDRRADRERARAPGRLQLVHARARGDGDAQTARGRPHVRGQRRPRVHDRCIPEGREVGTFGSPTWRRRIPPTGRDGDGHGDEQGRLPVWIGLPISRDADQTLRYDVINAIVQTEAAKRKGPRLVPRHVLLLRRGGRRLRPVHRGRDREAREDAGRRRRPLRASRGRPHRGQGRRAPGRALRLHVLAGRAREAAP